IARLPRPKPHRYENPHPCRSDRKAAKGLEKSVERSLAERAAPGKPLVQATREGLPLAKPPLKWKSPHRLARRTRRIHPHQAPLLPRRGLLRVLRRLLAPLALPRTAS